ncbi:MAG: choice-of-anchor E domain-containing protein [Synechococcaceae cyanobacterium ELA739]
MLLLAAGAAVVTMASPAQAVTATQTVGPQSFTTTGGTPATGPFTFAGFNTALGTLTKVNITNAAGSNFTGTFGGTIQLLCNDNPANCSFSSSALPTFTFTNSSISTGTLQPVTLTPNPVTTFSAVVNAAGSGTYSSSTTDIATGTNVLRAYFAGTPTLNNISTNIFSTPTSGNGFIGNSALTLSGNVYLTYTYEIPPAPGAVPGPIPILGAGAAFGFSRKLRKRIRSTAA